MQHFRVSREHVFDSQKLDRGFKAVHWLIYSLKVVVFRCDCNKLSSNVTCSLLANGIGPCVSPWEKFGQSSKHQVRRVLEVRIWADYYRVSFMSASYFRLSHNRTMVFSNLLLVFAAAFGLVAGM